MIRISSRHAPAGLKQEASEELRRLILHPSSFIIAGSIVLALLILARSAWAQEAPATAGVQRLAPPGPDAEKIASLLARLGDESWAVRQESADALIAIGAPALPALAELRKTSRDLQTHAALDVIEAQIAGNLAQAGRPIYVRLQGAEASQAMREIAQQAGITIQVDERRLKGVVLDGTIEGLGWWQAVLRLCAAHDLDVRPVDSGLRVTRATDGAMRTIGGPVSASGPILILARGARYDRSLSFDRTPVLRRDGSLVGEEVEVLRETGFSYAFDAMLEARFVMSGRRFTVALTQAVDDAGNVLIAGGAADGLDLGREIADAAAHAGADAATAANMTQAEWSGGKLRFEIALRYPASPGRTLRLAGRMRGMVGADLYDAQMSATELSRSAACQVAGERVNLRLEPSAAAGRWSVTAESARIVTPEVAELLAASFASAELTDAAGERFRRGATHNTTEEGRFGCRLEFIGPAEEAMLPRRLTCRLPRRALELDVPFEFNDLPMP